MNPEKEVKMKMYYVTLNNQDEAKTLSHLLLEKQLAVCTNWFPISCAYKWEGEIKNGSEIVLIIKTKNNLREKIEKEISKLIHYTNYIAEIDVHSVNHSFLNWLDSEVPDLDSEVPDHKR